MTKDDAINQVRQHQYKQELKEYNDRLARYQAEAAEKKRVQQGGYKEAAKRQRAEARGEAAASSDPPASAVEAPAAEGIAPAAEAPVAAAPAADVPEAAAPAAEAPAAAVPAVVDNPAPVICEKDRCFVCGKWSLALTDSLHPDDARVLMKYRTVFHEGEVCRNCFERYDFDRWGYYQWLQCLPPGGSIRIWYQYWDAEHGTYACQCSQAGPGRTIDEVTRPPSASRRARCDKCRGTGRLDVHTSLARTTATAAAAAAAAYLTAAAAAATAAAATLAAANGNEAAAAAGAALAKAAAAATAAAAAASMPAQPLPAPPPNPVRPPKPTVIAPWALALETWVDAVKQLAARCGLVNIGEWPVTGDCDGEDGLWYCWGSYAGEDEPQFYTEADRAEWDFEADEETGRPPTSAERAPMAAERVVERPRPHHLHVLPTAAPDLVLRLTRRDHARATARTVGRLAASI